MKIRFIINPVSGTGKQKGIEKLIQNNLHIEYDIVYTEKNGDASILSQEAIDKKIDIVVAVGGDGTVNECAKTLIGSNLSLGVIPCGSGNGFAYHLGMKKSIKKAIRQLNSCTVNTIDSCTANEEKFVNIAGMGFDAHIAKLFANNKKRGFFTYLKLILKELTYKPKAYKLEYDDTRKEIRAYFICFANASQYGNDFKISPNSSICDGLIDFVIVKEFPKWKIPLFLYTIAKGKAHLSKDIEFIQAKEMIIEAKSELLHLDGEPKKLNIPITIKVHPKTLKIFSPNGKK
jgi:YegS/Rv2252/BmrU family lipid kinase|tara:strand:- start:702 stop:1568 length:867 start_codon:yes stop_codon:yes gene_type:complete